jgi:hypothetical protein
LEGFPVACDRISWKHLALDLPSAAVHSASRLLAIGLVGNV